MDFIVINYLKTWIYDDHTIDLSFNYSNIFDNLGLIWVLLLQFLIQFAWHISLHEVYTNKQ